MVIAPRAHETLQISRFPRSTLTEPADRRCNTPQRGALGAGGRAGASLQLPGADLHLDLRVGNEVAIPTGMRWRAALRGDDDIAVAVRPVKQGEDKPLTRFAAGRRQKQRRHGQPGRPGCVIL
jgi:hypothetical protein